MRFFFYGTLIAERYNPVTGAIHAVMSPGAAGTTGLAMVAIPDPRGWYPALLPDREGLCHGYVHEVLEGFTWRELARMDQYEGADYSRREIAVTTAHGLVRTQAYLWNREVPPGAVAIPDGRFSSFLAQGHRAFGDQVP